ncbi:MAG TPA: alpha/beta fold hydrolase, partial [Anaerolineae bacterium]|nr:alpha/beta fold hydrolase [Anaerolineae bacterium]
MIVKNSDGTETFFQEAGDPANDAMALLHGIGADHKMWQPQIRPFADNGYFVLAPDMLGHGQSSRVKTLDLRDWENQINDLLAYKGLSNCILIGVSMGGVIAQSYTMNNPEKVSRLALSDTFGELKTWREKASGFLQLAGFRIYKILGNKTLAKSMASVYKAPFASQAKEYFSQASLHVDLDQLILARKAINKIDAIQKTAIPILNWKRRINSRQQLQNRPAPVRSQSAQADFACVAAILI